MSDAILAVLAFAATLAGMAAFALANEVHWRQLFGAKPQVKTLRILCKLAGSALLGVSFLLCALADPVSMAILVWPMMLGVAGATVAAFLTVRSRERPRSQRPAADSIDLNSQ
jgi:hypothetical protein